MNFLSAALCAPEETASPPKMSSSDKKNLEVGRRLAWLRLAHGLPVTAWCREYKFHGPTWVGYEGGRVPPWETMIKIANATGARIDWILRGDAWFSDLPEHLKTKLRAVPEKDIPPVDPKPRGRGRPKKKPQPE